MFFLLLLYIRKNGLYSLLHYISNWMDDMSRLFKAFFSVNMTEFRSVK
jgi:hypothetical protein